MVDKDIDNDDRELKAPNQHSDSNPNATGLDWREKRKLFLQTIKMNRQRNRTKSNDETNQDDDERDDRNSFQIIIC